MRRLLEIVRAFAGDDRGATAIEYSLICSLIVMVIVATIQQVSAGTIAMYDLIVSVM